MNNLFQLDILTRYLKQPILTVICILPVWNPGLAYVSDRNATDISSRLFHYGIIPDLLRMPPLHTLKATYPYGYSPDLGNKIDAQYLKNAPYVILWPFDGKKFYTLLLVDLDAPSPKVPSKREWLHYMLANIPGPALSQGEILAPHVQPNPREGTHRLVYLVFMHPRGRIEFREKKLESTSDPARSYFSSKKFARKYNLGDPFAVNFFLVKPPVTTTTTAAATATTAEDSDLESDVTELEAETTSRQPELVDC